MISGIYKIGEIPVDSLISDLGVVPRPKGRRKREKENELLDIVCAFDIETTKAVIPYKNKDYTYSFMYIWQFQIGPKYTVIGRTWEEFTALQHVLMKISDGVKTRLKLSKAPKFCTYVHNLAYEWQYLQGVYKFDTDDVFFRDARKPIYCTLNRILELRCSYLHSNLKLEKFGEFCGASKENLKLSGEKFDYSKTRYPWTELTDYEMQYCVNDVRVLEECIRLEMERDGDTLKTIPLTATGYIRRECKAAIKPLYYTISQLLPDRDVYDLLRRCFRGGNTHANRFRVGVEWENVASWDRESSYPDILLNYPMPMGPYRRIPENEGCLDYIVAYMRMGYSVIADYTFKGIHLKDHKDGFPYIPRGKCHCVSNVVEDNGRVISADILRMSLTEVDLEIVLDQYDYYTIRAENIFVCMKALLPQAYRDVIRKFYQQKTSLRGDPENEYLYKRSKAMLNAAYGMSAQQAVHPIIEYSYITGEYYINMPGEEAYSKQLKSAPFPYQWGVYCTAYARAALQDAIKAAGKDKNGYSNVIYVDTDSIKAIGNFNLDDLNKRIRARSSKNKATAKDREGKTHYIGVWDHEYDYERFKTLGAKRYAFIKNGKLGVTVSGVSHVDHEVTDKNGKTHKVDYASEELGKLSNFKEGFIWKGPAGGTTAVYMDKKHCVDEEGNDLYVTDPKTGKKVKINPCVSIVNNTYKLTMEDDYNDLWETYVEFMRFVKETGRVYK